MEQNKTYHGNCLEVLKTFPDNSINCCITSPPYWGLRDYGTAEWEGGDENCKHINHSNIEKKASSSSTLVGTTTSQLESAKGNLTYRDICGKCGAKRIDEQIGLEKTPEDYVARLAEIFEEVKRVLKPDGTLWLNIGDSYAGSGHGYLSEIKGKQKTNKGTLFMANRPPALIPHGLKPKDLVGIPWRVAFALQQAGWYLRQDIIWHKPNPMPESVTDRCTKSHEYIFLLSKENRYYFDSEAIQEEATGYDGRKDTFFKGSTKYLNGFAPEGIGEQTLAKKGHERWRKKKFKPIGNKNIHPANEYFPRRKNDGTNHGGNGTGFQDHSGYNNLENPYIRNKRSVWTITTKPFSAAHFATFPEDLIVDCIKAGCSEGGIILDPFMGAGTTAVVARKLGRNYIGVELNEKYIKIANKRLHKEIGIFL